MRARAAQMAKTAGSGLKKKPLAGAAASPAGGAAAAPAAKVAAKKGGAAEERPWWVLPAGVAVALFMLGGALANAFQKPALPSSGGL